VSGVLELESVHAGYLGQPVVRDLNLHVDEGEVVALLGANGAGKTTTLLTVSGILPVLKGDVRVLGESIRGRRPFQIARRGVAHVPEDRSLFFDLTVRENLKLGSRRTHTDTEKVTEYFTALEPLMDQRAGLLSGGEQQMLALARALTSAPRLLMVDEMSLGLAPVIVEGLLPVLRQIATETGAAVLLVEQHVHLVLEVADRAYALSHGSLTLEGPTADLRTRRDLLEVSYLGGAAL
jgi:branched-chain amino acid transport system ATP-binding protein